LTVRSSLPSPPGRQPAGFTLIETAVALVLLLAGLLIAADLLMETARLFVETSGEALDTPVPLVLARIRGDFQDAASITPEKDDVGNLARVKILMVNREIEYQKVGDSLYRTLVADGGGAPTGEPEILWRGITAWSCTAGGKSSPVWFSVTYQRRTTAHTPLAVLPAFRGALQEKRIEKFYVLPRGQGW
jgi:prepilin-type N-terminal cleavage/methylation domain-containing protein